MEAFLSGETFKISQFIMNRNLNLFPIPKWYTATDIEPFIWQASKTVTFVICRT